MKILLGLTGASGAFAARLFLEKANTPIVLVASSWGIKNYERECGPFAELKSLAEAVYDDHDLAAPFASGSVLTAGMAILPCSVNTLAKIAHGIADTLITRAAHCQLKEKRPLILCVRESPYTLLDMENMHKLSLAGAIIMPLSPPFYMTAGRDPKTVSMAELFSAYVDRVLSFFNHPVHSSWESMH